MEHSLTKSERLAIARIVGIYALFGTLWIYLSDSALGLLTRDTTVLTRFSVIKGILFIALTALLLYQLIGRYVREHRKRLEELNSSLEERVNQAAAELREKDQYLIQQCRMAAMGEMLGNIAHQWRQPLNVLGLMVQELGLIHEYGDLNKDVLEAKIGKVMEIVLHLSQTIDDFRDFASPDRQKTLFRVEQVVAKTVGLIEDSFNEKQIAIDIETHGEPQISGFPREYGQVLLNILMNARDAFLERKTTRARITVRAWNEDGRSVVTITDNAGGIRDEIMDRIFDAYFTTKELGKGTGVGLFMSMNIIEKKMGGRLTARNVADGAEFRIEV